MPEAVEQLELGATIRRDVLDLLWAVYVDAEKHPSECWRRNRVSFVRSHHRIAVDSSLDDVDRPGAGPDVEPHASDAEILPQDRAVALGTRRAGILVRSGAERVPDERKRRRLPGAAGSDQARVPCRQVQPDAREKAAALELHRNDPGVSSLVGRRMALSS